MPQSDLKVQTAAGSNILLTSEKNVKLQHTHTLEVLQVPIIVLTGKQSLKALGHNRRCGVMLKGLLLGSVSVTLFYGSLFLKIKR